MLTIKELNEKYNATPAVEVATFEFGHWLDFRGVQLKTCDDVNLPGFTKQESFIVAKVPFSNGVTSGIQEIPCFAQKRNSGRYNLTKVAENMFGK